MGFVIWKRGSQKNRIGDRLGGSQLLSSQQGAFIAKADNH